MTKRKKHSADEELEMADAIARQAEQDGEE